MKLADYRNLLTSAQSAEPSEGHHIKCGQIASQIENAAWNLPYRAEAAELAAAFRAESERSLPSLVK